MDIYLSANQHLIVYSNKVFCNSIFVEIINYKQIFTYSQVLINVNVRLLPDINKDNIVLYLWTLRIIELGKSHSLKYAVNIFTMVF